MRRVTLLAPLLAVVVVWAQAGDDYYKGLTAYERSDYEAAFRLWKPLAEQGNAESQYRLGRLFETGHGVPRNDGEAVEWYRRAAEQGHASAQYRLGAQYVLGDGVPQDGDEGAMWFRRAAEQGLADAQVALGLMYESNPDDPDHYVYAHFWLHLAAAQGDGTARKELERIEIRMTLEQIAEARKLWREWKLRTEPPPFAVRPGPFGSAKNCLASGFA